MIRAKDHLAGKRAPCPKCKTPLTIPAASVAAAPAASAALAAPEDVEALAAAALAGEAKPEAPAQQPTGTVDFTCPQCDAPIKISVALAGKNAPCPECRRIVKVPLPVRQGPKDWREVDLRPSGAKREELEGAWGSTTSAGAVSREALVEAEAIPEVVEPVTLGRWVFRGVLTTGVLCLVVGGVLLGLNLRTHRQEDEALKKARAAVAEPKSPEQIAAAAEVHRALGEFYAREDKATEAQQALNKAREYILKLTDPAEQDAMLIDLALTEVDLGGEPLEKKKGTRLTWEDVQKSLTGTLSALHSPQARFEAVRLVGRKLLVKKQPGIAIAIVRSICTQENERQEATAQLGLEMLRAEKRQEAQARADDVQQTPDGGAGKKEGEKEGDKKKRPSPPPSLVILRMALEQPDRVDKLGPDPRKTEAVAPEMVIGYAGGLAWTGKADEAVQLLKKMKPSLGRFEAAVAVAAALADTAKPDAARLIPETVHIAEDDVPGLVRDTANLQRTERIARREAVSWLLLRLVRAGVQAGVGKEVLQKLTTPELNPVEALRGRAQLELLRGQLKASKGAVDHAAVKEIDAKVLAHGLGLEAIARHNAHHGQTSLKGIDGWSPEVLRPYGYIGVALGVQDK
jgi:hypothetical protein